MRLLRLFTFVTALLLLGVLQGQAQVLPLDEHGKVSFYAVVKADSLPAGLLFAHAKSWLSRNGHTLAVADSAAGRLVAAGSFSMYDRGYLTKKLHGKVAYQVTVEVKEGRYRLQINDLVFAYYQEDRTYHLVPTGKTKLLEDATAAGWQKLWETHRKDTALALTILAADLKTAMLTVPKAPVPPQARNPTDW